MDTACSSTLVAFHTACQGLRSGAADIAIVAGANLFLSPDMAMSLNNQGFLSPDGRCWSFDEKANGYGRGEGFGAIILKRVDDAIADNDVIRAVVRATGTNQDGRTPGIVQPSRSAQADLIRDTYRKAGLDMRLTRYVEAHGTGTSVGDPIEAGAIADAFGENISSERPLYIGSVKSNIGHLEGTSGIAGLVKSILMLEKGMIPAISGLEEVNKTIAMNHPDLVFPMDFCPWPSDGVRRLSINSFGFGGTNAHVVMDDAQNYLKFSGMTQDQMKPFMNGSIRDKNKSSAPPKILVFSAQDEKGIGRIEKAYNEYLATAPGSFDENYLTKLAFTLSDRRSSLLWRSYAVCNSHEDLKKGISLSPACRALSITRLLFCFTGQGAQWFAMGRELKICDVYWKSIRQSASVLEALGCPWSLSKELSSTQEDSQVNEPEFSQTLCTAVQIAVVDLLESVGVRPVTVVGHSSGEIAAAYCMGALDRRSAISVAYYRGLLSSRLAKDKKSQGRMLSAGTSETKIHCYFSAIKAKFGYLGVSVGCINSPSNVTVTGDEPQIDTLKDLLDNDGIFARKLAVGVAYHSTHMNTIATEYSKAMGKLSRRNTVSPIKMVSSVTGGLVTPSEVSKKEYWTQNMVSPVRFVEALSSAASLRILQNNQAVQDKSRLQVDDVLEIGPHSALQRPVKDTLKAISNNTTVGYASSLVRGSSAVDTLYNALGYLHCRGHKISIKSINELNTHPAPALLPLTNLPEYQFDHSNTYWRESRVSKGHRFRGAPRNDFLGMRVPDWNPLEAKWRRRIKLSEDPWIGDHTIAWVNILPAAAMVVMAVEAAKSVARSLSRSDRVITGYTLKDITFSRAITIVPDSDGTEVEFYLRSGNKAADREETWSEFRLYCIENDAWVEACSGSILVSFVEDSGQVDRGLEVDQENARHASELARIRSSCSHPLDMNRMYRLLAQKGVEFGPAHQVIKTGAYNEDQECFGELDPNQWKVKYRKLKQTDYTIHPTTLDGLFHLGLLSMTDGGTNISPSVVAGIQRLWIAEPDRIYPDDNRPRLLAWNKSDFLGLGNTISTVVALDSEHQSIVVLDGLEGKFLKEGGVEEQSRRLCWNFDYRPDIELLTRDELHDEVTTTFPIQPSPFQLDHDVKLLLYLCILRTLKQLTPADIEKLAPHHQRYLAWMQREKKKVDTESTNSGVDVKPHLDDDHLYIELLNRLENENKRGRFYAVLSRNIYNILTGTQEALELMFQTPLVKDYYRELYKATNGLSKALAFLDLYAHKHPNIKILEIGAGTGGMTKYILDRLTQNGSGKPGAGAPRFSHYTYTDISAGFFSDAAPMFENFSGKVTFSVLDIEKDPVLQGFEEEAYDLIIADNVFHATQNLDTTVKHARKLLKPGGKLALFELTDPEVVRTNFAFGLLPGWWRYADEYREFSAGVSDSVWDTVLKKAGFSGIDLNLQDYDDTICHEHSALISTAVGDFSGPLQQPQTLVVFDDSIPLQKRVCDILSIGLKESGVQEVIALSLEEAVKRDDLGQWFCIVILEVGGCFLRPMDGIQYQKIKRLFQAEGGMLWVCMGGGVRPEHPDHALIQGAFRGLRMEERHSKYISLSLEATSTDPLHISSRIIQIFDTIATKPVDECEQEYVERNGNICIDRFIEADYLNQEMGSLMQGTQTSESKFGDHKALTLSIRSLGLLDSLEFVEDEAVQLALAPDEIMINVEASGVNFRDCLIALGRIPGNSFGFECSGTVSQMGHEVRNMKIGDRVCASAIGSYQTYTRCKASDAILIPSSMSFVDAAALPVVFTTAFYALVHVAHIQKGESILIHSAAGGTGQAAIQVAKMFDAEIFVTVGSDEKKSLLMNTYQIHEDHIFDSRNTSFVKGIERMTTNRGVDVVLNSLSGDLLVESWQCIAPFGRFLELGKKDILSNGQLPMRPFSRNASFHAIDLNEARKYHPVLLQELRNNITSLLAEGKISPPQPVHVYGVGEIEKAFRYLQGGKNTGKTVIEIRRDDIVKTNLKLQRTWKFNDHATYIIAGGLGGIGRSTARWMAARGAKNLVLLSRSGISNDEARELVDSLRKQGTRVEVPLCNIAQFNSVKDVIDEISTTMPPIKGCIQSAMVLRNKIFGNMTYQDWTDTVDCKVSGTWNLHRLLPTGMDFFIMFSSVAGGVGGTASVNYSSACAYQDALTHYRNSIGERATTLNLGVMVDDGTLRDNDAVKTALLGTGYLLGIRQKDMFALLEHHCNPDLGIPVTPLKSQVIVGIDIPSKIKASGAEVPNFMTRPMFRGTWNIHDSDSTVQEDAVADVVKELVGIRTLDGAADIIATCLMHRLSKALGVPLENLDSSKAIHLYGVDSLVAVELRNWFKWKLEAEVAVFEVLGNSTFEDIGALVAGKSRIVAKLLDGVKADS
ncbi:Type I Polyketide synthases (Type I PKS) [Aspergillus tanneri]|uniref:Type I Polyketide synthases (Type I PKS) n=1 Tax=Aspergillus tanneri TaxID=1220188 RepID=A0A5M9N119_9EURO|nr:Type I Polyketide synthases (Type I PKS) [Aspergillus tanneri]KAA8651304.1 Type I Polyketide synthases (Type I PKS) [Aspergillus tanneri]